MPMFESGQQADASLSEGTFLAYLLPPEDGGDDYEWIDTLYGGAYKLFYNVFVPGARGTRRYQLSELASPQFTTEAKLIRRMGAANGLAKVPDTLDLSTLKLEGFCLVKLGRKEGSQYLDILDSSPLPRNYPIPTDVRDNPASRDVLTLDTQTVPVVERVRREELPTPEQYAAAERAAEEPPF